MKHFGKAIGVMSILALSSCEVQPTDPAPDPKPDEQSQTPTRSISSGTKAFERVAKRVRPTAVNMCRQKNAKARANFCDFRIVVDTKSKGGPNAYQTIGKDGRPVLAFNQAMLTTIQNDHEIAFILGHEAGHQINKHIGKQQTSARIGGFAFGLLVAGLGGSGTAISAAQDVGGIIGARTYSKDHEIEADVIGTYIATLSGYNPEIGAKSFARFGGGSRSFLSTHPPSSDRAGAVSRTISEIKAKRAAGKPLTP